MGSLSLLQGNFLIQKSNWSFLHCRQIFYQMSYQISPSLGVFSPKPGVDRHPQGPSQPSYSSNHILDSRKGEEEKGMPFPFKQSYWKSHSTLLFIDHWPGLSHVASPCCTGHGNAAACPAKDWERECWELTADSVLPDVLSTCRIRRTRPDFIQPCTSKALAQSATSCSSQQTPGTASHQLPPLIPSLFEVGELAVIWGRFLQLKKMLFLPE